MRYLFLLATVLSLFTCKSKKELTDKPTNSKELVLSQTDIIKKLYAGCNTCKISICKKGENVFYSTEMNAYDVGTTVYDSNGNHFVNCSYLKKDEKCDFEACEIVFVPAKNIWGLKAVDKFGLLD